MKQGMGHNDPTQKISKTDRSPDMTWLQPCCRGLALAGGDTEELRAGQARGGAIAKPCAR